MKVVIHEHIGVQEDLIVLYGNLQAVQEDLAVLLISKDGFSLIPTAGDMIEGSGILNAKGSGHAPFLAQPSE